MLEAQRARLKTLNPIVIASGAIVLVAIAALLDFLTGWRVDVPLVYVVPVCSVAWLVGDRWGIGLALFAGVASTLVATLAGRPLGHPLLPAVDFVFDTALFAGSAVLASGFRRARSGRNELRVVDSLTGVSTSDAFYEEADRLVKMAVRYGRPVTVAYLGVDNFTALNERFGHRTGDDVLISIARTLKQHLRETDIVARLAGDEFGVIFPETGAEAGRTAVEKAREQLIDATDGWSISFSIGAVTCDRTACTLDELIRKAERLMYEVKESGRNGLRMESLAIESE
jgi:diguanylate cyclase (GGDEF)-like protein